MAFCRGFLFLWMLFSMIRLEGKAFVDLSNPAPLIIDTDADIADMMAILYFLKSPGVDVKGITTVGVGMTHWKDGAKNISNLLELAGRSRIPVAMGAQESLSPAGVVPQNWKEEADKVAGIKLPNNPIQPIQMTARKYVTDTLLKSSEKVTLFCIGPMTNIALALRETPEIKDKIERIYVVGGAVSTRGNIIGRPQGFRNQVAEYNILLDAKAVSDVFDSGVAVTLIPLDVAEDTFTKEFYERISKERKTPAANFVYELLKPHASLQERVKSYFWEALSAVIMVHPEIATYSHLKLTVNLKRGPEYARLMMTKIGSSIQVVTGINKQAFFDLFLETLNRPANLEKNPSQSG